MVVKRCAVIATNNNCTIQFIKNIYVKGYKNSLNKQNFLSLKYII